MPNENSARLSGLSISGITVKEKYKGSLTKISMICPVGHDFLMKPNTFKKGHRCPKCNIENRMSKSEQELIELAKQENHIINGKYINNSTKISMTCPEGHTFLMRPANFKSGQRCPKCAGKCSEQAEQEFRELTKQENYSVNEKYKGSMIKISITCPVGHDFLMTPNNFKRGHRCPKCQGSTGQRLLAKLIEQELSIKPEENVRGLLKGKLELDLYFPSMNVAIEYQGNYWHNKPEMQEKDKIKKKLCEKSGIHLIEVWDKDFIKNQEETLKSVINELSAFL